MRCSSRFASWLGALVISSVVSAANAETPILADSWGSFGTGRGQFDHPYGLMIDAEGFVYVADEGNNRIQKLTSEGRFVAAWGAPTVDPAEDDAADPAYLYNPVGVALGPGGVFYVSEHQHHRVSRWTRDGRYIGSFGRTGSGRLAHPVGIAIDADGYVYVASSSYGRVEKFTSTGAHVQSIGGSVLQGPYSVALDGHGFLYVGENAGNRILKFTTQGVLVEEWRAPADSPIHGVRDMAFHPNGQLYVSDIGHDRVAVFALDGRYLGSFRIPPPVGGDSRAYAVGLAIDRRGENLYVTAWGEALIHRYAFGNRAPDVSAARAADPTIWPPNHALVPVEIVGVTDPDGDPVQVRVTAVMQDEPVRSSGGRRCLDAMIDADGKASVRAEREMGSGANGRFYHLSFEATDGRGGRTEGEVSVCVPAQLHRDGADDGPSFNSLTSCTGGTIALEEVHELALGAIGRIGDRVTIDYRLPAVSEIEVGVFDVAGRRLATLERGMRDAGVHRAEWNTEGVGRGVYFCRMRAGESVLTKTFIVR
jgi:DNA-binding beta-propeller fold protein YncE